MQLVHEKKMHK